MHEEEMSRALGATQKFLALYRHLRQYGREIQEAGIRGRELSTLRYLLDAGELTVGQICEYLFISVSATSELVSRMEDAGYVIRRRCTDDNRVVYVALTPRGRLLAEQTPLDGIPLLRERIKSLPPERLTVVDAALTELLDLMEIKL